MPGFFKKNFLLVFHRYILPSVRSPKKVFAFYWLFNLWGNPESRSGDGSTLRYTEGLRKVLPNLLRELEAKTFLDAPCGDFHWMRHVAMPEEVEYIGGDIVAPMIRRLQKRYASPKRHFLVLDVVNDPLPKSDLWMCRDLVFHLPNQDVLRLLDNFLRADIEWLLITSHVEEQDANRDIRPGQFRFVNLLLPPFSLPQPRRRVRDYIEGFPERYLYLYHRKDLQAWRKARG